MNNNNRNTITNLYLVKSLRLFKRSATWADSTQDKERVWSVSDSKVSTMDGKIKKKIAVSLSELDLFNDEITVGGTACWCKHCTHKKQKVIFRRI